MEYGNGIVGDMCVHMLDTARWMLGLGWPKRVSSAGGISWTRTGKSNISDTQTATFEYDDFNAVAASHLGRSRPTRISVGAVYLRRQRNAQGQHHALRISIPHGKGQADPLAIASTNASNIPRT